jgi:pimeloyl-ACP methyl ester carboxylesterase
MAEKPSLVFVPGAWHTPEYWGKVVSAMENQGYKCIPVALPTTLSTHSANYATDVKAVRDAILAETTHGRDAVVLVHSYGGAVGASAIKGLTKKHEDSSTDTATGHVIGLFMVSTGFTVTGLTFLDRFGGKPPPFFEADYENNLCPLTVDARELFYHDLPEEEGKRWVDKLTEQALTALTEGYEAAHEGWREVPVWYVATKEDKALPVEVQRMYVQDAKDSGADVTLRELESSHSPMLSKPQEMVDVLLAAIKAFA